MGFADKWHGVEGQAVGEDVHPPTPIRTIRTIGVDDPEKGNSANIANIAKRVPGSKPDVHPLVALARFERDPRGVVSWLARQQAGQPPHLVQRWAAAIRAEARWRLEEGALHGNA